LLSRAQEETLADLLTLRQNSVPSWLPHWPTWSVRISRGILFEFFLSFFLSFFFCFFARMKK